MTTRKFKVIVGIDEVGRGSLAGPVVASAVVITTAKIKNKKSKIKNILRGIKDSKKLSPKRREEIFEILKSSPQAEWGIGKVSQKVIDKINILQATKLAMERAARNLEKKVKKKTDFLLIDGNFGIALDIPQKSIIRGDEKIFLIKVASIIAKVTRDRAMLRYHRKYPLYRFDKHKGYGTKLHLAMLKKHGPCRLHRRSFSPIKNYCQIQ